MFLKINRAMDRLLDPLPVPARNIIVTAVLLVIAYLISAVLHEHSGSENNSALVFTLAITCIARFTTGYIPGIVASFLSAVAINYSQNNDSLYMHGDTLRLITYNLNTDSVYRKTFV